MPSPVVQRAALVGVRLFETLLRSFPPDVLRATLDAAGRGWYFASRRRRVTALANLELAFGDRYDDRARRRIARASFGSFGRTMADFVFSDRFFGTTSAIERRVRFVGEGWDELDRANAAGRGGLIYTAHLGSWESGLFAVRHRGLTLHPVVRTLDNPYLDEWVSKRRGGDVGGVIRKGGAVRRIVSVVRRGEWVAFVGDQNAGKHAIFVPFFGLDAASFPTPGLVATRLKRPVFVAVAVRRPRDVIQLEIERVPEPPRDLDPDARIAWVVHRIHLALERWIRANPEQYTWLHRRWKTRPKGESADVRLPAYPRKRRRPAPAAPARPGQGITREP